MAKHPGLAKFEKLLWGRRRSRTPVSELEEPEVSLEVKENLSGFNAGTQSSAGEQSEHQLGTLFEHLKKNSLIDNKFRIQEGVDGEVKGSTPQEGDK